MPERQRRNDAPGRYEYESGNGKFHMLAEFHLPHGLKDHVQLYPKRIAAMSRLGLIQDLTIKTRPGVTSQNDEHVPMGAKK